jgi:hypothetical protein
LVLDAVVSADRCRLIRVDFGCLCGHLSVAVAMPSFSSVAAVLSTAMVAVHAQYVSVACQAASAALPWFAG